MRVVLFAVSLVFAGTPLWVAFEVLNPQALGGHRILHLEDVVGPARRKDVAGLPSPTAVLLFAVPPEECARTGSSFCDEVERRTVEAREAGALVLAVLLADREAADRARRDLRGASYPFPLVLDAHGVARRELDLHRPGVFVVIDAKGHNEVLPPSANWGDARARLRHLDRARATLLETVRRDREEDE